MRIPWFWCGVLLIFSGGTRFLGTIFALLAWDFVIQELWQAKIYWMSQTLFLILGWGQALFVTWLGIHLIKREASK